MPLFPSPLAAATLLTVKMAGYSLFARALNRRVAAPVSPLGFGAAKTALGFVGGFSYLLLLQTGGFDDLSEFFVFFGAAPIRFIAWAVLLGWFYKIKGRRLTLVASLGVCCSYLLDAIMWLLFKVMLGMVIPVC